MEEELVALSIAEGEGRRMHDDGQTVWDFLGQFLECDAKSISKGYQSYMRIQGKVVECSKNLVLECPGDGNPRVIRRFRHMLRDTNPESFEPWLVMGDFNKILYSHEKQGGSLRDESCMEAFRFALDDCDC
ncbi:hypothetical protein Gorai_013591 [Gossypium raimondii]|uniref:Endonuclease/exonuclease/phosphatase domain-containing protein n=1 Tax=Gossypium raimondii TaxID=29730 RepID=A0A7J8Q6K2_GOSRA|nr:hypothetical protein [Gossypium raimondii]